MTILEAVQASFKNPDRIMSAIAWALNDLPVDVYGVIDANWNWDHYQQWISFRVIDGDSAIDYTVDNQTKKVSMSVYHKESLLRAERMASFVD